MIRNLGFFISAVTLLSPFSFADQVCQKAARRLVIASTNVENLLNPAVTRGEALRRPPGYNQAIVDDKVSGVKASIDFITTEVGRPDALIVVEIHDEDVGAQLAQALGYKHFKMTRSRDERGMDVAIMWNESDLVAGATYIDEVVFENEKFKIDPTRNVLLVELDVDGDRFVILANHWPSLMNPTEMRADAALETRRVMAYQLQRAQEKGYHVSVLAGGDFNTIPKDLLNGQNPFDHFLLEPSPQAPGPVFLDAQLTLSPEAAAKLPPASYWYKGDKEKGEEAGWNRLDRMALTSTPGSRIQPVKDGFRIHIPPGASKQIDATPFPVPDRYFFKWENGQLIRTGRSDHFPISMSFDVLPRP